MSNIAAQFGEGLGSGTALRTALDQKTKVQDVHEEHALGAVLVAAIFEGFQRSYHRRSADLIRIATGGTGILPQGALHPDLGARLATECVRTAQSVLTMCIRAFDYLPPADIDFGSFLRALVTADWELNPLDETGLRASLIEASRLRGIFVVEACSLAVSALLLDSASPADWSAYQQTFCDWVDLALKMGAEEQRARTPDDDVDGDPSSESDDVEPARLLRASIDTWFSALADDDRAKLGMRGKEATSVGFHASHRVASDGTLRFGLVVQLVEMQEVNVLGTNQELPSGATLVIDVTGDVRFVIRATPADSRRSELESAAAVAGVNALGWKLAEPPERPFVVDFRGLHAGRMS